MERQIGGEVRFVANPHTLGVAVGTCVLVLMIALLGLTYATLAVADGLPQAGEVFLLAGQVLNDVNSAPIAGVTVSAVYADGSVATETVTAADGRYSLFGVAAGEYTVKFASSGYQTEFYDNAPFLESSTLLTLALGDERSSMNSRLLPDDHVAGVITDAANGGPLANVRVWYTYTEAHTGTRTYSYPVSHTYTDVHVIFVGGIPHPYVEEHTWVETVWVTETYTYTDTHSVQTITGEDGRYALADSGQSLLVLHADDQRLPREYVQSTRSVLMVGMTGAEDMALTKTPLSGRVLDDTTGIPLAGTTVTALSVDGSVATETVSAADGRYAFAELAPGEYHVRFLGYGYQTEFYDNARTAEESRILTVAPGAPLIGIDARLLPSGHVGGVITDAVTGEPLANVRVWHAGWLDTYPYQYLDEMVTGADGRYWLHAYLDGDTVELHVDDQRAPREYANGTLSVLAGAMMGDANLALKRTPLSGRVFDERTGSPVGGGTVSALRADGSVAAAAPVGLDGYYALGELAAGEYFVRFAAHQYPNYYHVEFYDGAATLETAQPLAVASNQRLKGIDAHVWPKDYIAGVISDAVTGEPLANIRVSYSYQEWHPSSPYTGYYDTHTVQTLTAADGRYELASTTGQYTRVLYVDDQRVPRVYTSTTHSVFMGDATRAEDIALVRTPLTGRVIDEATLAPVGGATVAALRAVDGSLAAEALTDTHGYYAFAELASGEYHIRFSGSGYQAEFYDNTSTSGESRIMTVVPGAPLTGIDARLLPTDCIAGAITDVETDQPLANVRVWAVYRTWNMYTARYDLTTKQSITGEDGRYALPSSRDDDSLSVHVDDQRAPREYVRATRSVVMGAMNRAEDFALTRTPLSGRVFDERTGSPVDGGTVSALRADGSVAAEAAIGLDGCYAFDELALGEYFVRFAAFRSPNYYHVEFYDDAATSETAQPLTVVSGQRLRGIDARVWPKDYIAGVISDAVTGEPLANIRVSYSYQEWHMYSPYSGYSDTHTVQTLTAADGHYEIYSTIGQYTRVLYVDDQRIPRLYTSTTHSVLMGDVTRAEDIALSSNTPPGATDLSIGTGEDLPVGITLPATDSDGDELTYTIEDGPAHGSLSVPAGNQTTYTPAPNYNGSDSFTFKANDAEFDSNVAYVSIDVTPINDAPVAIEDAATLAEDGAIDIAVVANDTDVDGDSLMPANVSVPEHGAATVNADGSVRYVPAPDYNGPDSFTYTANDAEFDSNVVTVAIDVTPVNDAPSFAKGSDQTVLEDGGPQTAAYWAKAMSAAPPDESAQLLDFLVTNDNEALFSAQPAIAANGTLSYTPATHANGTAQVTVRLRDGGGSSAGTSEPQIFAINVTSVNDAPTGADQTVEILEDGQYTFGPDFGFADPFDIPANVFTGIKVLTLPAAGALEYDGRALTSADLGEQGFYAADVKKLVFVPVANASATPYASFDFEVVDDGGSSDGGVNTAPVTKSVSINVTPLNDAPNASVSFESQNVQYSDQISDVAITAKDVDSGSVSISSQYSGPISGAGLPAGLSLVGESTVGLISGCEATWTLTGTANLEPGTYVITFSVDDGDTRTAVNTVVNVVKESALITSLDARSVQVPAGETHGHVGPISGKLAQDSDGSPGDLGLAHVVIGLSPVGSSGTQKQSEALNVDPTTGEFSWDPSAYEFGLDAYEVSVWVIGDYFTSGTYYDGMAVYDPSLGYATGGGWFKWPGTAEKTSFGFVTKYGKNGSNAKGSLVVIRHGSNGEIYRLKSNALTGLSIGQGAAYGWASLTGKGTYSFTDSAGLGTNAGNYSFLMRGEDWNQPGTGVDKFSVKVNDPVGAELISNLNSGSVTAIGGGNIVAPHTAK